jgi:hypothetical protein
MQSSGVLRDPSAHVFRVARKAEAWLEDGLAFGVCAALIALGTIYGVRSLRRAERGI